MLTSFQISWSVCGLQTGGLLVALPQVREPAAAEDPVPVRGPLSEQPHCGGDQPKSVSLRQIHHPPGETQAFMDPAALQGPAQVTQAQGAAPVDKSNESMFQGLKSTTYLPCILTLIVLHVNWQLDSVHTTVNTYSALAFNAYS